MPWPPHCHRPPTLPRPPSPSAPFALKRAKHRGLNDSRMDTHLQSGLRQVNGFFSFFNLLYPSLRGQARVSDGAPLPPPPHFGTLTAFRTTNYIPGRHLRQYLFLVALLYFTRRGPFPSPSSCRAPTPRSLPRGNSRRGAALPLPPRSPFPP